MTIATELAVLMQTHDDDPEAAAAALRAIAVPEVPPDLLGRFSWLVAHVLGEKLGRWLDAHDLMQAVSAEHASLPLSVLRNAAVSAHYAGKTAIALALERRMTEQGLTAEQAAIAVRAAAVDFSLEQAPAQDVAANLRTVLADLAAWDQPSSADSLIAASLNNVVSALLESNPETLSEPDVRDTLIDGANAARKLWARAGTWINAERADYLCALVFNATGEYEQGLVAAERGLAIIEANGSEDVDRAFLLLESGRALLGLSRAADGLARLRQAAGMAREWDDKSLKTWFDEKVRKIRGLTGELGQFLAQQ